MISLYTLTITLTIIIGYCINYQIVYHESQSSDEVYLRFCISLQCSSRRDRSAFCSSSDLWVLKAKALVSKENG